MNSTNKVNKIEMLKIIFQLSSFKKGQQLCHGEAGTNWFKFVNLKSKHSFWNCREESSFVAILVELSSLVTTLNRKANEIKYPGHYAMANCKLRLSFLLLLDLVSVVPSEH